jgi:hypothetical protein
MPMAGSEPLKSMQNNENGYVTIMLKMHARHLKIASLKAHFRLGVGPQKIPIMGNLSTSWLIVWHQVISKILFVWWSTSSCVKKAIKLKK